MNPPCPYNHTHPVNRFGFQSGRQMYWCVVCKRKFSGLGNIPGMQYPRNMVWQALTFYFNGMSYENLRHTFDDLGYPPVAKVTLWRWVVKYSDIVRRWVLGLTPRLGAVWVADETVIKVDGEDWWFWDVIDYETRYLLASHFSKTRGIPKAQAVMQRAMVAAKQAPRQIITDKLADYFKPIRDMGAVHITSKGFAGPVNTNLIERFQGTIKQRTKVMRHFKDPTCAGIVLDGLMVHYNFLWERQHLQNTTPAVLAGIGMGIESWNHLIDYALMAHRVNPAVDVEVVSMVDVQ